MVYTVYLEKGERIGNIPWQVGKKERNRGEKRKRLGRQERSERGNKKKKGKREKENESQRRRAQRSAGRGEAPGTGRAVGLIRLVPPRPREEDRATRDHPLLAPRIWAPLPVRGIRPGSSSVRELFSLPAPGRPQGGAGPGWGGPPARQSRTIWALWARLSSSPGLTCQADYLRGRLIGEAGCNNNRFV